MAKRRKIGLIYQYNENWIGGTYYIENLISALAYLPERIKPELIIFTGDSTHYDKLKQKIKYPYLSSRNYLRDFSFPERCVNKIGRIIFHKNYFNRFHKDIDIVFPAANEEFFKKKQPFLYWIPDFQEHFLPAFFKVEGVIARKKYQATVLQNAKYIVFSSETVKKDFNYIYPDNKLSQFLVQFAVTHPAITDRGNLFEKYKLPTPFFICNNQFWKHKNHEVILRAIRQLKQVEVDVFVAFTGKEHDYRNPEYFDDLKKLAKELLIEKNIKFLGFIDRVDQLCLMKHAIAVIQPSLFEGWSTVIEDAKSMNLSIIASDIEVHKEQLQNYYSKQVFSAEDEKQLANRMLHVINNIDTAPKNFYDYQNQILKFGNSFVNTINKVLADNKRD